LALLTCADRRVTPVLFMENNIHSVPLFSKRSNILTIRRDISCFQLLIVPNYPALARAARIAADVTVSVVIGHDSASHQITTQGEKPHGDIRRLFSEKVEKAVRSSTFNHQCVGKTIELIFSFELGNDPPTAVLEGARPAAKKHSVCESSCNNRGLRRRGVAKLET
jgi:hypothetical protein